MINRAHIAGRHIVFWLLALWLGCRIPAEASAPQGDWQTLGIEHFRIHYLPQDEAAARTLAAMAPGVRQYVMRSLAGNYDPATVDPGTVEILLVSWTDLANGLSTQIPYNQIQIHLFPPRSFETLQAYRSWLETVLVHEYTHAVHIAMARGPTRWLRYVFGRSIVNGAQITRTGSSFDLSLWPVLPFFTGFPNQFLPAWDIEGLAVNVESWATGRGRLYAPQSREIMRNAAVSGALPRWDDLSSFGRTAWPYGTADYLYGAGFLGSLPREHALGFQRTNALGLLPMLPWASYRAGTGTRLNQSWYSYRMSLRREAAALRLNRDREPAQRNLTGYGDRSSLTSDGTSLFWIERDGSRPTAIVEARPTGTTDYTDWQLTRLPARGAEWLAVNQHWLAAQVLDWPNRTELRNRLVLWRRSDTLLYEPANGWHMLEPSLNARNDIAAVRHTSQVSEIWLGQVISDGSLRWQSAPLARSARDSFHTPAVSPDGSAVAYVAHRGATAHDIMLWERATGHSRVLYSSAREDMLPLWLDNSHIRFVSDRSGEFQLYSVELTGAVAQHTHTAQGWYQSAEAAGHSAALRLGSHGYRISLLAQPLPDALPALAAEQPYAEGEMPVTHAVSDEGTVSSYSPWRMLLPHAWSPIMYLRAGLFNGTDPFVAGLGASLGSSDLLGRHSWSLSAASRLDRWQPEGTAGYSYGGERVDGVVSFASYVPTLSLPNFAQYEARYQSAALYASAQHPARTHSFSVSGGAQVLDFALPDTPLAPREAQYFGRAGGPFLSLAWNSYTRTPRVNGPHNGIHLALRPQLWITHDFTGRQSALAMALAEAGTAWHLFARNRLSVRLWAGASGGDVLRYRAFAISGDNFNLTGDGSGYNPLSGISLLGLQHAAGFSTWAQQYIGRELGAYQLLLDQPIWMPERGWANLIWFQGLRLNAYFEGAVLDFSALGQSRDWTMPPTVGAEIESSWAFVDMIGMRIAMGYLARPAQDMHLMSLRVRMGL